MQYVQVVEKKQKFPSSQMAKDQSTAKNVIKHKKDNYFIFKIVFNFSMY